MKLEASDLKNPEIQIREKSALEFGENVLEKGVDSSFFDIILASHWLRYSHRHPNDPVKEFHQLFEQAVQKFDKGPQEPIDINALHAWVRYNFDFKASSKSSVEMLKEKTYRCATATDLILSILEELGLDNLHAIYFFDHKQAAYKEADGSLIVMDPNDPHPVRRDGKEARGVVLDFEEVKKRKLAVLDRLIKKEKGQPEVQEGSPQVIEKMSRFFKEGVYKTLFRALSTPLFPDPIDEDGPPCKDSHGSYLSLLTMAISHLVSIPPPKSDEYKNKGGLFSQLFAVNLVIAVIFRVSPYTTPEIDDAFLTRIKTLCEPTERPASFAVVALDQSLNMSFPLNSSQVVRKNPWDTIAEERNWLIDFDFSRTTKMRVSPHPDFDVYPNLADVALLWATKFIIASIQYRIDTPYFVYRVDGLDSRRLSFDQAGADKHAVLHGIRCLVALDNEGEVVEVLRRDQE